MIIRKFQIGCEQKDAQQDERGDDVHHSEPGGTPLRFETSANGHAVSSAATGATLKA